MRLSQELRTEAQALVGCRLGLEISESRRADFEQAILRACQASSTSQPGAYLKWLESLPDESREWRELAGLLTVGETYFFRDAAAFEVLEREVLTPLVSARRAEGALRLRLWSAGCATGEEPYSLAILLDRLLADLSEWSVTLLATDINLRALELARRGRYRKWSFRDCPSWIRDRYFEREAGETFQLDSRIRSMVSFAPLNLAKEDYPSAVTNTGAMDVVFCRNVLMYFGREAQQATAARLQRALMPGGWLVVSAAELSAELFHPLTPVSFPGAIFYRKDLLASREAVSLPTDAFSPGLDSTRYAPEPTSAFSARPAQEAADASSGVLSRARGLADQGNLEEAGRLCEEALRRNRLDTEAHLLLAAVSQERGDIPAALEALRRVIYLAPDCAPAYFLRGALLFRKGDRRRGRSSMETVLGLLESSPRDALMPGSEGLTAGRLLETARAYLELS